MPRLLLLLLVWTCSFLAAPTRADVPVTGSALPGLAAFDSAVLSLLERWRIPGASLAVAKNGSFVLARGYGYADLGKMKPATPDLRFRLASLSKSLTATAIMKLVEDGHIDLDQAAVPLLADWAPPAAAISDPRVHEITVRHLLTHRGGWNREISGDPAFDAHEHVTAPNCLAILRGELTRKLDFTPGAMFAYSNTGYCILGRIIERVSGMSYAEFVSSRILRPSGSDRMTLTRRAQSLSDEPIYYQTPGSMISPYDGLALDAIDSLAGWVARPVDYLRYFLALNGHSGKPLLQPKTLAEMTAGPAAPPKRPSHWYGLGVRVQARSGGLDLWHHGSMPGTQAEVVLSQEGVAWVIVFNARPLDAATFSDDIDATLWAAARQTKTWPTGSLFN